MTVWYDFIGLLPFAWSGYRFMANALLAVLILTPLFGILSTNVVTGKMSFFSDALGHSAFTGIAIGVLCGMAFPIWAAVVLSLVFAWLFTIVKEKTRQSADTIIGVFSSTAVALGIFIATSNGGSFTKFNRYLIGDILSVSPGEIGLLALVLTGVLVVWFCFSNRILLITIHPQLAASRGISVRKYELLFTMVIAVTVTLAMSWVGLLVINSLLVLPAASARNMAKNMRQYLGLSVLLSLLCGVAGLLLSFYLGCSTGAAISLLLAICFAGSFLMRRK